MKVTYAIKDTVSVLYCFTLSIAKLTMSYPATADNTGLYTIGELKTMSNNTKVLFDTIVQTLIAFKRNNKLMDGKNHTQVLELKKKSISLVGDYFKKCKSLLSYVLSMQAHLDSVNNHIVADIKLFASAFTHNSVLVKIFQQATDEIITFIRENIDDFTDIQLRSFIELQNAFSKFGATEKVEHLISDGSDVDNFSSSIIIVPDSSSFNDSIVSVFSTKHSMDDIEF